MGRTLLGKTARALGNHPDGNAAPPHYGLRIDNLFGGVDPFTFDFECVGCDVKLVYDEGPEKKLPQTRRCRKKNKTQRREGAEAQEERA